MLWDDLKTILVPDIGTAGGATPTLFRGYMPDEPDTAVAVYEYGGPQPTYSKAGVELRNPRVQIACRGPTDAAAFAKAHAAYDKLAGVRGQLINGTVYDIRALQEPFQDGVRDSQARTTVLCNYQIRRR